MGTSRRDVLAGFAAVFGSGLLTRTGLAHAAEPEGLTLQERFLWRILKGVDVGAPFHDGWVLLDAYPPMAGGVTLVVADGDGAPLRVDVVRRDDPPRAPAYTDHLELYTMDGGGGVAHQPDALVDALQALAARLQDNEAQGGLARFLMTHRQRIARYPAFMERASKELAPVPPDDPT